MGVWAVGERGGELGTVRMGELLLVPPEVERSAAESVCGVCECLCVWWVGMGRSAAGCCWKWSALPRICPTASPTPTPPTLQCCWTTLQISGDPAVRPALGAWQAQCPCIAAAACHEGAAKAAAGPPTCSN